MPCLREYGRGADIEILYQLGSGFVDFGPIDLWTLGKPCVVVTIQHHVFGHGKIRNQPCGLSVFGNMGDTDAVARPRRQAGYVLAIKSNSALGDTAQSGQSLYQGGLAVTLHASDTDDFAAMNR